jgi:hypothetical protein
MHHDHDDCCKGKVRCKKPRRPRDIKTECIFVERVFDSRIFKTQEVVDCCPCPIKIDKDIVEVIEDSVEVTCKVIKFKPTIEMLKINGQIIEPCDYDKVVTGPGGMEQIDLRELDIDFKGCEKKDKGVTVNIRQKLSIECKVKVTVTGEGIKYDDHGCPVTVMFTGSDVIECGFDNIRVRFNDMCLPNNTAVFPVLIGDACAANCIFDLDTIILCDDCDSCGQHCSDEVKVCGELIFCIKCEKKIKFPVEICVLTTGFCKEPEVDFGRCGQNDFPDLFPVQYPEEGFPHLFDEEEEIEIIEEPYEEIVEIEDFDD